jgi:excisionase family DNA binding protein
MAPSQRHHRHSQADHPRRAARDCRARRERRDQARPALARWRSYRTYRPKEPNRSSPLGLLARYRRSDLFAGAPFAGSSDRFASQPAWQDHGAPERLDPIAGVHLLQPSRHRRLSGGERAAHGEYTLQEAAQRLGMRPMTVLRVMRAGHLPATQFCKGTPWVVRQRDLERSDVQRCAKFAMQRPISTVPGQLALAFR